MANAMFRALTHGGAVSSTANAGIGTNNGERDAYSRALVASPGSPEDAAAELREWLTQFNGLLEPPSRPEDVARGILDILQHFFPARQSAIFLTDPHSENLWVAAARGVQMSLAEAEWVERTAREALARCDVLGRESSCTSLSSFLWVPILCEGRSIGVIEMGDCSGHWFSGGQARELSRLADDVGLLLVRFTAIAAFEDEIEGLKRDLSVRACQGREMERRILAGAGREAVFEMATSIAERAMDPVSYVLANLRSARDEVDSIQSAVSTLVQTARVLVDQLPQELEIGQVDDLRAALAVADKNNVGLFLTDLGPLIEDVEEGASRLQSVGADFRELALGETAPMGWVDFTLLIERVIGVISRRETGEHVIEVRVSEIPPVRCQRLRMECLLIDMLGSALAVAAPGSPAAIQVDLRGSQLIVEVAIEVDVVEDGLVEDGEDEDGEDEVDGAENLRAEHDRLGREIAEDHGGQISVDVLDDQWVTRLTLPIDRD